MARTFTIQEVKAMRVNLDSLIQRVKDASVTNGVGGSDYSLAVHEVLKKLIEARMWSGKILEGLGSTLPAEFADKADAPADLAPVDSASGKVDPLAAASIHPGGEVQTPTGPVTVPGSAQGASTAPSTASIPPQSATDQTQPSQGATASDQAAANGVVPSSGPA